MRSGDYVYEIMVGYGSKNWGFLSPYVVACLLSSNQPKRDELLS